MKKFLDNNRTGALMTILILALSSVSIVGTSQFVMGQDGANTLKNLLGGCIYGACKNTTISGGSGSSGQHTSNTATLNVIKKFMGCGDSLPNPCPKASLFKITVTGNNPQPFFFDASETGTQVVIGPGQYKVSEPPAVQGFFPSFSGDCNADGVGNIKADDTQTCTITNTARI